MGVTSEHLSHKQTPVFASRMIFSTDSFVTDLVTDNRCLIL